jgi:16S rRNA (guanine1207-N2)-methyltransferase
LDIEKVKEDIIFKDNIRGIDFTFHSTWGLFSPKEIDAGSRLLIDFLEVKDSDVCLDIGCGYGVIGLNMAKMATSGKVYMIDKDFVAVEYAKKNVIINQLTNCEVFLSNAFSNVSNDIKFDVIASNLPANVGKEMLYIILSDAMSHLNEGGKLYVVTIAGLREFIKRNFRDIFGNYEKVKQGREHAVHLGIKD